MKCYYHNDHDGRCAGAIVAHATSNYNKEDFFEVDYTMELPLDTVEDGETVLFVDYSFKENTFHVLEDLLKRGCEVIWIDHHTSSIRLCETNDIERNILGVRLEGISGAALTWMYLYNCEFEDIPYFVKLISDYDCWQYKYDPDTTHFKLGIETVDFDALDEVWKDLIICDTYYTTYRDHYGSYIDIGETIKTYIDKQNTYYREHFAYESEVGGYKCLVVNQKTNSWVFGEKYNEYPIVMVWVFDGEKYTYSIFSGDKNVDCCKIAESYGGGGHRSAAGFSSSEMLFRKVKGN